MSFSTAALLRDAAELISLGAFLTMIAMMAQAFGG
jgi:hypothetical protein